MVSNSLNILSTRKRGKCNIKNSDNVPHVITQLVIDMINVVSFRVSISLNEHLVSELETYQHQGWKMVHPTTAAAAEEPKPALMPDVGAVHRINEQCPCRQDQTIRQVPWLSRQTHRFSFS